jgi:Lecithin retinol acyltransferase
MPQRAFGDAPGEIDMNNLPLGAHLTTPRRRYVHHGVYVGEGRVVHYAGSSRMLRRGPVEEVSLEEFTRGHTLHVKANAAPRYVGQAAVERARSRLGEDRYRVLSNNCEHFAEWVISGTSRSLQVQALARSVLSPFAKVRDWTATVGSRGLAAS